MSEPQKKLDPKDAVAALEMLAEIGKNEMLHLRYDISDDGWEVCDECTNRCYSASTPLRAVKKARKALGLKPNKKPKKRTDGDRFRWLVKNKSHKAIVLDESLAWIDIQMDREEKERNDSP